MKPKVKVKIIEKKTLLSNQKFRFVIQSYGNWKNLCYSEKYTNYAECVFAAMLASGSGTRPDGEVEWVDLTSYVNR